MLESLLNSYAYPLILVGTFLEGETILVLGGVSAHMGYLSIKWVVACGFAGTLLGDQLYFYLGRRHGTSFVADRPAWPDITSGESSRPYWAKSGITSSNYWLSSA